MLVSKQFWGAALIFLLVIFFYHPSLNKTTDENIKLEMLSFF